MNMIIQTDDLTKRFKKNEVVSHLNISVEEKSIYGFLGPNGAGKTTTIKMLLGLITPTQGDIQLFGQSLRQNKKAILKNVGSLAEAPSFYPHLTGRENLQIVTTLLHLPKERIDEVLKLVDLTEPADRRAGTYSLGMKQRLGIALALIHQPKLLVLDEPTNGLDPQGIREMREFLRLLPERFGLTVFLSSHLLSEVEQIATHIGILNHGKLIFQGTLKALQDQTRNLIEFKVSDPQQAQGLLQNYSLASPPALSGDYSLTIRVPSEEEIAVIIRRLVENHIDVYAVVPQTLHLEDFFFHYTHKEEV